MEFKINGKIEKIKLNNHIVSVISPIKTVSYEEGNRRIEELVEKIKKSAK